MPKVQKDSWVSHIVTQDIFVCQVDTVNSNRLVTVLVSNL